MAKVRHFIAGDDAVKTICGTSTARLKYSEKIKADQFDRINCEDCLKILNTPMEKYNLTQQNAVIHYVRDKDAWITECNKPIGPETMPITVSIYGDKVTCSDCLSAMETIAVNFSPEYLKQGTFAPRPTFVQQIYIPEVKESVDQNTEELIEGRRGVYGDPEDTFKAKAAMWTILLRHKLVEPITAEEVSLMMVLFKVVRAQQCPPYSDNPDDIKGYAEIFELTQGNKFIKARSVDDYLKQKKQREDNIKLLNINEKPTQMESFVEKFLDDTRRSEILDLDPNRNNIAMPDISYKPGEENNKGEN